MAPGQSRLFYYDCVEDGPRSGEDQDAFALRTESQRKLLAKVHEAHLCHIRLGTLKEQQRGKRITQKEVDVKIAVDMLTHAAGKSVERVVLLTGDLDFRPVVESLVLVQLGTVVELCYDPLVTAIELQQAADLRRPLTLENWMSFCTAKFQANHPMPRRMGGKQTAKGRTTKFGQCKGRSVRVWVIEGGDYTIEIDGDDDSHPLCITHKDRDFLLNKYLPLSGLDVAWE